MLKLIVSVLALALAGTAAAGWRDLRVDGTSEEAFAQSMAAFKQELSPARQYVFGEALKDIWIQSATAAEAAQREYTADEYYELLDGLRYEEVVNYTDPTGDTAKTRFRDAPKRESRFRVLEPVSAEALEANRTKNMPRDASAEYWTTFGGGGDGPPRGSPSLGGPTGQQ
jgi:hypothetical protein